MCSVSLLIGVIMRHMQQSSGHKKLLLIDANSLIHRFFHALPPLTTPQGEPIGAIYGLAQVCLKILRELKPTHIAAAFDRPEPTFRDELFKAYKAQRPPTDNALIPQLQRAHDLFDKCKIKTFELPGFEADDIIATLAEKFRAEPDVTISIFSGDRDTLQLVEDDKVVVEFLMKGITETQRFNEAAVREKFGLAPSQLNDYKAFVGDASDNIPGVAGIGPKTALPLILEFKTVEGVFENLDAIPQKIAKKLEGQKDVALLSKKLSILDRHAPIYFDSVDDLVWAPINIGELKSYFAELGFRSLVQRLEHFG